MKPTYDELSALCHRSFVALEAIAEELHLENATQLAHENEQVIVAHVRGLVRQRDLLRCEIQAIGRIVRIVRVPGQE